MSDNERNVHISFNTGGRVCIQVPIGFGVEIHQDRAAEPVTSHVETGHDGSIIGTDEVYTAAPGPMHGEIRILNYIRHRKDTATAETQ